MTDVTSITATYVANDGTEAQLRLYPVGLSTSEFNITIDQLAGEYIQLSVEQNQVMSIADFSLYLAAKASSGQ